MRIGIDLGGTKVEVIALGDGGHELYRQRLATPQNDYAAILKTIALLVSNTRKHTKQQGSVGIGIPGALSPITERVKNSNSICLIGQSLKTDLESTLDCPVKIENDANCFVVSEATDGAAQNAHVVFGVIIGTGTGGGICINKHVLSGCNAIAGEWGHNALPWQDTLDKEQSQVQERCYCGKSDCIETFLSGPGFEKQYQRLTNSSKRIPASEILEKVENGNAQAITCIERYEQRLAKALAYVINIIDPDIIVLGGGMSNIQRLYKNVPLHWGEYVFSDHIATRLVAPKHGDSSGVRGAAWLWPAKD
ncbi:ROK family protein [Beggiatoa alba]|nr:ROK family protein [Beggiatoa alba]